MRTCHPVCHSSVLKTSCCMSRQRYGNSNAGMSQTLNHNLGMNPFQHKQRPWVRRKSRIPALQNLPCWPSCDIPFTVAAPGLDRHLGRNQSIGSWIVLTLPSMWGRLPFHPSKAGLTPRRPSGHHNPHPSRATAVPATASSSHR